PEGVVSSYTDLVFGEIAVASADIEDGVLLKSDGLPTYNFANVIDDHLMGITHVMRGVEYLSSTPKYNLMYDAFGWERPTYIHLSPIMKDAQRKLSKRYGDANFEDFVAKGYLPEAIVNYIALLGWCPKTNKEKMTIEEMIEEFDVDGISKSPAIFDEAKMRWLNGEYLKAMTPDEFYKVSLPYILKSKAGGKFNDYEISRLMQTRVDVLSDIPEKIDFLVDFDEYDVNMYVHQKMKVDFNVAKRALKVAFDALAGLDDWAEDAIKEAMKSSAEANGMKGGQVMFSVRVALTGQPSTPGGAVEMAVVLGKEESLRRLQFSMDYLDRVVTE
ncbi:MAG: glutamate--tRNA ligase, partial [Clostridia bacterium]|nr:glutamate--tRNA ligase [Clostridia bacterium]